MLDIGPGEPIKAGNIDTEPRKLLSIKRVEGLDGVVYYVPVYGNPIAPTVDATKKDYNGLNSVPPELKLHNIADGGTMSQTRETWADSWRVSEPISYSLINDAYGGVQGLPFFGDLLKRGVSSSVSNLDGTTNQDPIGSFINTAAMFFGGGSGKLVPKHLSVRVFRWFNKFMPWKATKGGVNYSNVLNSASSAYKGSTVLGHALSKHGIRKPSIWGKLVGDKSTWHNQALKHFDDIMNAPGSFIKTPNDRGINFLEKRLHDGRGVRLNMDGTFKGFID
jgi:hypothetical protein